MKVSTSTLLFTFCSCLLPTLSLTAAASDIILLDPEDEEVAALPSISSDDETFEIEKILEKTQYTNPRRRSGSAPLPIRKEVTVPAKEKSDSQKIFLETPYPLRRFALEIKLPETSHAEENEIRD